VTESNRAPEKTRRSVLNLLLTAGGLGWIASVLYPVISYLKPLPVAGPSGPVGLTRAEVMKIERNKFAIIPVGTKRVLVLEDASGELHALDAKCTHEGCTVQYLSGDGLIWCACHNARFDLEGRVLGGPPPRPLSRYGVQRKTDGSIVVAASKA
jgi:cytochrome b6-f complex iron-sulfur subunit